MGNIIIHHMNNANDSTNGNPAIMAQMVRAAREAEKATQQAFAQKIGRSQATLSKYEAGTVSPPGPVVIQCMNILGITAAIPGASESAATSSSPWDAVYAALAALNRAIEAVQP